MARQTGGSDKHPGRPFFMRMGLRFSPRAPSSAALQIKNRLEWEFQPVANARVCLTDYDCAPSRKRRRLK